MPHVPVLAGAALEYLRVREDGTYVDCTAGAGGHAALIAERLGPGGRVVAMDRDATAVQRATHRLAAFPQATVLQGNYGDLDDLLDSLGVASVDGVLIDAGVSSMQLDEPARGFSFQSDGPLDMRMNPEGDGPSAAEWLADVGEDELTSVLKTYGDLPKARKIARALRERQARQPLERTEDLAGVVAEVFPFVQGMPQETRRVFQAIRMAVNDELRHLERGIEAGVDRLAPGGRIVCISFHSGEDRIVKNVFRTYSRERRERHPDGRTRTVHAPKLRLLTKQPVTPDREEQQRNPRAHSARLRAAERR